jgi:predicted protein tyrosine phosphatase
LAELTIEIASRVEAGLILGSHECAELTYLVSIGDPYDPLPDGYDNISRKLRLVVADVVTDVGATEEDIQQVIQLAEQLRHSSGRVLIHCEAGISRSTATALILYACWLGPGREREAMERVRKLRPSAVPNRRKVRLADALLGREGRLIDALGEAPGSAAL